MSFRNLLYSFGPDRISFVSKKASKLRLLYFPLCSTESKGIKSSVTPHLSGDIKIDKSHFLTKPASREDLRFSVRNFFANIEGYGIISTNN